MCKTATIILALVVSFSGWTGDAFAQTIERGKLKSLDLESKKLVVTADGKDRELMLTDRTQVLEATGDTLAEKLKDFKAGVDMQFVAESRDGKEFARGLKLVRAGQPAPNAARPENATRQGKLVKLDADKNMLTLEVDGKNVELAIVERTQVQGARGDSAVEKLKTFAKDAALEFMADTRDGKVVLLAIRPAQASSPRAEPGQRVSPDHAAFKPLTEMGTSEYRGFRGGLYPDGQNERPTAHDAAGRKIAASIKPLNSEGQPDEGGKIVLLSLGMSNASQVSDGFQSVLRTASGLNSMVQFVNGSQGGMVADAIQDPEDGRRGQQFWTTVDNRLQQAGVTRQQVQAIWIKQADAGPTQGFPGYPQKLQRELKRIVQIVTERFPNAKLAYLSSRTYGGFATTGLNPEPVAYESGFAVKWLIEEQIKGESDLNFDSTKGPVKSPWLSWGPYLWANGQTKRADGFSYEPADFANDGTHHSNTGTRKTGELMLKFFQADATTKPWVMGR